MELEVYNEYAIVQHYSDLTDYISENIYILDKKNQSEIITENWGLIALGAVIVAGLIWLGIHLWNKHKEKKAKEAKTNKEAKEAKKIQEVAEQAAEKSNLSNEEIGDISNLLKFLLITRNQSSLTDNKAGSKKSIGNDIEYKWNTGEIKILDHQANQSEFKKAWFTQFNNLKEKLEQYKKVNNLIGNWAKKIKTKDVNDEVLKLISNTADNEDVILKIDKKTSQIVGKMIDRFDFVTLFKQVTDAEAENTRIENMGKHETSEIPFPNTSEQILQSAFKSYKNNKWKFDIKKACTTVAPSLQTQSFIKVLKEIPNLNMSLVPDDISNDVSKKTYEFLANVIDATDSGSGEIGGQFTTISKNYSYFIMQLLSQIDALPLPNVTEDKKDDVRLAILSIYAYILIKSILSLYNSDKPEKAIIITELIFPKELNDNTDVIKIDLSSVSGDLATNKTKLEQDFKDYEKRASYKKDYQANSKRIIQELLYIDSALDKITQWVNIYKATYIAKFCATGATVQTANKPTSQEIRDYIEED